MSSLLPSRKVAALAVASSGLAVVLTGAFASVATAAPAMVPSASDTSSASSDWFVDPRTPAQRKAGIPVPENPREYRGKVRETRAVYRTHAGALAVPVHYAFGNTVAEGQAVTLDNIGRLFGVKSHALTAATKSQLRKLDTALGEASSVRCEGYTDYVGNRRHKNFLAGKRAARVCDFLVSVNKGLVATSIGYGPKRPAVVGGTSRDRRLNRRVVVEMTGSRPAAPHSTAPGAPLLNGIQGNLGTVSYSFTAPTDDGGTPITGYEVSLGDGWTPVASSGAGQRSGQGLCLSSCDGLHGILVDVPVGSTSLRVRAVNAVGPGAPSNTLSTTVYALPDAPTAVTATAAATTATVTFSGPAADGGSPVLGYQVRVDDGIWEAVTLESSLSPLGFRLTDQEIGTHTYGVRAYTDLGFSQAALSSPVEVVDLQPNPPVFVGGWTWSGHYEVSFQDGEWKGVPWTGYELSVNNGPWLPLTVTYGGPSGYTAVAEDPGCQSTGGSCGSTTGRIRVVTATGASEPSNVGNIYLD